MLVNIKNVIWHSFLRFSLSQISEIVFIFYFFLQNKEGMKNQKKKQKLTLPMPALKQHRIFVPLLLPWEVHYISQRLYQIVWHVSVLGAIQCILITRTQGTWALELNQNYIDGSYVWCHRAWLPPRIMTRTKFSFTSLFFW